jgi:hypothetical protein
MMPADDRADTDRDPAVDDRDEAEFMAALAARHAELLDPADLRVFVESDEGKAFLDAAFHQPAARTASTDGAAGTSADDDEHDHDDHNNR